MRTSPESYRCAIGKTEQRGNAGPRLSDATTDGLTLLLTHRCVGQERTVPRGIALRHVGTGVHREYVLFRGCEHRRQRHHQAEANWQWYPESGQTRLINSSRPSFQSHQPRYDPSLGVYIGQMRVQFATNNLMGVSLQRNEEHSSICSHADRHATDATLTVKPMHMSAHAITISI